MNATKSETPRNATVGGAYWIPEENLARLTERLDRLARRAAKLGLGAIEVATLETEDRPVVKNGRATGAYRRYSLVRVAGPRPRLAGWTFAATLEHLATEDGETVNVLRATPNLGVDLPERYRTQVPECDHCKLVRARIKTYVHVHDGGSAVVTEAEAAEMGDAADCGGWPIGPECLRKHPELKPYAVM